MRGKRAKDIRKQMVAAGYGEPLMWRNDWQHRDQFKQNNTLYKKVKRAVNKKQIRQGA